MAYAVDTRDAMRAPRATSDRILKGAKPAIFRSRAANSAVDQSQDREGPRLDLAPMLLARATR